MKIKTDEVKKIIDEEFIKVAREIRRLTEREAAAVLANEARQRSHALGRYRGETDIMGRPDSNRARRDREKGITRGQFSDYQLAKAEEMGVHPSNIPDEGESAEMHKGFRPGTPKTDHDKRRDAESEKEQAAADKAKGEKERGMRADADRKTAERTQQAALTPVEEKVIADFHVDELIGALNRLNKLDPEKGYHPERSNLGPKFKAEIERRNPSEDDYDFAKGQDDIRSDQIINNFIRDTK